MVNLPARPHAVHLPGNKLAVSTVSVDRRMIAVDEKGSLFVSEDSGATWEDVKRQWTGHAVLVRRRLHEIDALGAAAPESAQVAPASAGVSQPDTVFELVNDQGKVWVSTDGKIWVAR